MPTKRLLPCRFASPLTTTRFVEPDQRMLVDVDLDTVTRTLRNDQPPRTYELAGPRRELYFDPTRTTAAIVTCGGLCPGLNDVVRAIFMQLWHGYGLRRILGLKYGYQGLNPACGHTPILLDYDVVDDIHQHGGSVLATSRGPQDPATMVDFLVANRIDILFAIGGDGTQRGANAIASEIAARKLPIAVIGIPKSIDNDIDCIDRTFGFDTAVSASTHAILAAHTEAKGAPNGIGIVKLMGRHSGFIAAWASLACSEVNLTLVPEVPVRLAGPGGMLDYLERRLRQRQHAVIVVAEGAGQALFAANAGKDASGNTRLMDIGQLLQDEVKAHMRTAGLEVALKYIDPSYMIRAIPASAGDSVYCLRLGQHAAHAGMAGYTGILIGTCHGEYTHVPIDQAIARRKTLDPDGWIWQSVLQSNGQPDWR